MASTIIYSEELILKYILFFLLFSLFRGEINFMEENEINRIVLIVQVNECKMMIYMFSSKCQFLNLFPFIIQMENFMHVKLCCCITETHGNFMESRLMSGTTSLNWNRNKFKAVQWLEDVFYRTRFRLRWFCSWTIVSLSLCLSF